MQAVYAQPFSHAATPPRVVARDSGAWLRALPAIPPGSRYYGVKVMGMATAAARPGAEYVTVLFERSTSRIAAFLDAALITGYRTAATSAAALDRLIPQTPARLGVLGSGLEAAMHIRAFAAIRTLEEVVIYSTTPERRAALARSMAEELGVPCRAVAEPQAVTENASIVLAAARSRGEKPILYGDWLRPGMAVVSIGSTVPEQREVDSSVIAQSDLIVCDMVEEVLDQTGDLLAAAQAGIAFKDKAYSLNALIQGELTTQLSQARLPMFKSVGGGLQDVVVAEMILTRALQAGLATPLPIQFETKTRS